MNLGQKNQICQQENALKKAWRRGTGPMSKYRKVMEANINVTSTVKSFRTTKHAVARYEQAKSGLSYFYPKKVGCDGIHFRLLNKKNCV